MEAIRTEKHQTRYQPLQPYMDEKALGNHSRPWKQVLMFFARTQKKHEWKSPKYRFTSQQRKAWEELVTKAEERVGEEEQKEEQEQREEEEGQEEEETGSSDALEERELGILERACLNFCIALLDQQITRREYDSALVCALAILGVKENGWRGPDQYPPTLSAMIKIARFMVIQQGVSIRYV